MTSSVPSPDDVLNRAFPLLAGARHGGAWRLEELPHGAHVLTEGEPVRELCVLVRGEVEERRQHRLVSVVRAPRILELDSAVLGRPSAATHRCDGPAAVTRLSLDALPRSALATMLAEGMRDLRGARVADVEAADDFFDGPGAGLVPGPYVFGPFGAHLIVVQTEPERLAALLPPGLHAAPGTQGRYLVAVTDIENAYVEHRAEGPRYRYHETTPFIPCISTSGRPGMFTPELYPSSYMAILLGREIYGFPKRLGRTLRHADGADVLVDQARLLRARWSSPRPLSAGEYTNAIVAELFPSVYGGRLTGPLVRTLTNALVRLDVPAARRKASVFVRRRLLSEKSTIAPALRIDELVEVPFQVEHAGDFHRLAEHDVRFAPGHSVLTGTAVAVFSMKMQFRFAAGVKRRDYLARGTP